MTSQIARPSGFTLRGGHILAMLALFFGTVFSVNFYMARVAIATFSGLEADKPYQEGLKYDDVIAAARAQAKRNWKVEAQVQRVGDRARVELAQRDAEGQPTAGLAFTVTFLHPADRRRDVKVELDKLEPGRYAALADLAPGRWDMNIEARSRDDLLFRSVNRIEIP